MAFSGKATYDGGIGLDELAEDVSDIIGIVSPFETPLLDHIGDPKRSATSTVHEWIEDSLLSNIGQINQSTFSPDPQTDPSIKVDDSLMFRVGDLVRPAGSSEVMFVTSIANGTKTLTVVRSYGGTSPATLANNMQLHILGNAALEGDDAPDARFTTRVRRQNYTQIFTAAIEISGSMQASRAVGIADELDYQKQERMREMLRDLENCVINGVAPTTEQQGSSSTRRSMNGIIHSLLSNVFEPGVGSIPSGGGAGDELDETVLNAAIKEIWDNSSGNVDTIVVNGSQKRRINAFATGSRAYLPEDTSFRNLVSVYESDYGVCKVILSRWMPVDKVLLLDSSRLQVMPLQGRSFHHKPLASTGDSVSGQVIGEYTLEFKNESAHGMIEELAV
jgi:hypothetical protein